MTALWLALIFLAFYVDGALLVCWLLRPEGGHQ